MIYPNQFDTAQQIIDAYNSGNKYVMMMAQMQSGKTGVFMLVAVEMIRLGYIQRFVVISANNDADLKDQLKNTNDFFKTNFLFLYLEF